MEDNKNSTPIEADELEIDTDVSEEEDEALLDDEDESYDFNDEELDEDTDEDDDEDIDEDTDDMEDDDEGDPDGDDEEGDGADTHENEVGEGASEEEGRDTGGKPATEQKPDTSQDDTRTMMADMLDRLGYKGSYEEKMAAYRADASVKSADVDYRSMAEQDLRDINAAFGLQLQDFSDFDNLTRFAELRVSGSTALEAFRATQKSLGADTGEEAVSKPSKDHISPLPTGRSGGGRGELSQEDKQTLMQLRSLYPELSRKELRKSLNRVKRGR